MIGPPQAYSDAPAIVYANWGLWVADCPSGCGNAEHFGPHPTTGYVGGLQRSAFHCSHCGSANPATWPSDQSAIEAVLAKRPSPANRNWFPGETVEMLKGENIAHGLDDT